MTRLMTIGSEYHFSAAHFLTCVPDDHQCRRMHGHNYRVVVEIEGTWPPRRDEKAMLMDFAELDKIVQPMVDYFDHGVLNAMMKEEPTAENLADMFALRLLCRLGIYNVIVTVYETPTKYARAMRGAMEGG